MLPKSIEDIENPVSFMEDVLRWVEDPWGFGNSPFPAQIELLVRWREYIRFKTLGELITTYLSWEEEKSSARWGYKKDEGDG